MKNRGSILLTLFMFTIGQTQNLIDFETAIEQVIKNNLTLKGDRLKSVYQENFIKTSIDLPKTELTTEVGQINSSYFDTRFGLTQAFSFPTVYKRQKKLLVEQWKQAKLNETLKEHDLRKNLREIFLEYFFLDEKERLLKQTDQIYSEFLRKSNLRFSKGESPILEKTMADNQKNSVTFQLKQIHQEKQNLLFRLQHMLNSKEEWIPKGDFFKDFNLNNDLGSHNSFKNHIKLEVIKKDLHLIQAEISLEKSKQLPDFSIGVFSSSMKGNGNDDRYYDYSTRFQVLQFNIGIPIFNQAQKSRVKALKTQQEITENELENTFNTLQYQIKTLENEYKSNLEIITLYHQKTLLNAELIMNAADKQFAEGEINYLEWSILVGQTISIRSEYLDLLRKQNELVIQIHSLSGN